MANKNPWADIIDATLKDLAKSKMEELAVNAKHHGWLNEYFGKLAPILRNRLEPAGYKVYTATIGAVAVMVAELKGDIILTIDIEDNVLGPLCNAIVFCDEHYNAPEPDDLPARVHSRSPQRQHPKD